MYTRYSLHLFLDVEDSLYARVLLVDNMCKKDDEISLPDPGATNGKLYFHLLKVVN